MLNNSNKNKELKNNPNVFTEDREFITVNLATGDQFRKFATLRSENGPITFEQVMKFGKEAEKEAEEWWKNHPGESVTIRVLENEDGEQKQITEVTPKSDLIFSSGFRRRIYDPNTGEQIVGEENIRKEIERRQAQWNQWEKEGKLEVVDHQIHHTDDGSTVSVLHRVPPVKCLHDNEINDKTTWISLESGVKKIESGQKGQQTDENKASEGSSKIEECADENTVAGNSSKDISENIQNQNVEDWSIVEKIKKDINKWSVKKLDFTLSSGGKGSKDCLVHSSAKVNISELGTLIYPVEIFTDSEKKELSEVLNDSFLVNFISSGKIGRSSLDNYQSISLTKKSALNNTQQTDNKGKNALIISSVVFVSLIAGLVIVKSRFNKKE